VNISAVTIAARLRAARAPSGTDISCIGRQKEPALGMLTYNPDRGVAGAPDELIGLGDPGGAAFGWEPLDAIVRALHGLKDDQTMPARSRQPRSQRVLSADADTSAIRHADAGCPEAIEKAREAHIDLPMVDA